MDDYFIITKKNDKIENFVNQLESFLGSKSAIYISVPITTGYRFLNWYINEGKNYEKFSKEFKNNHYNKVIYPNIEHARDFVEYIRKKENKIVIDPTSFEMDDWSQDDYRYYWGKIIEKYIYKIYFINGWHYSSGCSYEFLTAIRNKIKIYNQKEQQLNKNDGINLIQAAINEYKQNSISILFLEKIKEELELNRIISNDYPIENPDWNVLSFNMKKNDDKSFYKDKVLNELSNVANIAQFVSFGTNEEIEQRYSNIYGFTKNDKFINAESAIDSLLENSLEKSVNIRSFDPKKIKGEPLIYGKKKTQEVIKYINENIKKNKISIVNETIDINDNGVSGVAIGNLIEFAPFDTPKCVEKDGVCSLPRNIGLKILETVYGFRPKINFNDDVRVEFSIHPLKRGIRHEHTIIWELEHVGKIDLNANIFWPNKFSKMLGDKVFGLLLANSFDLPVPKTTVITRNIAPFSFGQSTGTGEFWMRTSPEIKTPGKYITTFGWCENAIKILINNEIDCKKNKNSIRISSIISQESINPLYSGALIPTGKNKPIIEGVKGKGDNFMLGLIPPIKLPDKVIESVELLYLKIYTLIGDVKLEWVFDGKKTWIVQIHKSQNNLINSNEHIIYPGNPQKFFDFDIKYGLESLRDLIKNIKKNEGVNLIGDVGITSHFGDLLRSNKIPSRLIKN